MNQVGTLMAGWAMRKAVEWLWGKPLPSSRELDVNARFGEYQGRRKVSLTLGPGYPSDLHASLQIMSPSGEFVKGLAEYKDNNGNFMQIVSFSEGEAKCEIPFAALAYPRAGDYRLRVSAFVSRGKSGKPEGYGSVSFIFDLPDPVGFDHAWFCSPIIELSVRVIRAEGIAVTKKVSHATHQLVEDLGLDASDAVGIRRAMGEPSSMPLANAIRLLKLRFPKITTPDLLEELISLAKSDEQVTQEEHEVIREIAFARGMGPTQFDHLASQLGLVAGADDWAVLGLRPGATPDDIKSAYRRIMSTNHPDRFAQHPQEFQELATKRTIAANKAYDSLMARFARAS